MNRKNFDYFTNHESKTFTGDKQRITFTFNDIERTIIGAIEEKDNLIYLYEFRGDYIGIEFFISFSKRSTSYKLLKVDDRSFVD